MHGCLLVAIGQVCLLLTYWEPTAIGGTDCHLFPTVPSPSSLPRSCLLLQPDVTAPKQLTGSQRLPAPAIPPLPDFPSMVRRSSEPLQWANHQLPGQHHPHQHQLNATVELCAHMCAAPIVPQQPLQQSSRFHQESAAAGNTSDNTKRKRSASADGTAAVTVAAPAAASDVQPHRSKRKRHLTAKAVEAAVAGLLPAAAMIPPEVLAEQAATAESPSHRQLQEQQQQQQRPSPSPVPVLNSASSGLVQQTGAQVQQLSSSDPAKVQDALLQLFVLLRHGLYSAGDSGTADAMQVALSGLLQLLERHATISSDLLGITLHVLQTMARAYAACKRYILQCRSHVKLVRLLENATSTQVQVGRGWSRAWRGRVGWGEVGACRWRQWQHNCQRALD